MMHRVLVYITVGRRKIPKAHRTAPYSATLLFLANVYSKAIQSQSAAILMCLEDFKKFQHLQNCVLTKYLVLT
jgi:hypothetical protein